ncbi:MAG: MFS transporter [Candidatus Rokubacteria bacterium]|nr:MFS transporter [Candidatus Rokubacteria bacterium]
MSPRRSTRRWLIVGALFLVTYGVSTPLAAYGVFLPVLAETFGWSRGLISSALSLNLVLGGFVGFAVGALADRYGARVPLAITTAAAGAGFALISTVRSTWQLYLFVSVVGAVGLSSFYVLTAATVTRWFHERRGLALALAFLGFNVGYITAGPLAAWLITAVGWRAAYALIAGGAGLIATLAALTIRFPRAHEAPSHALHVTTTPTGVPVATAGLSLSEALRDVRLWYLNFSWLLLGALILMIGVHAVPFARDQGIGLAVAALGLTAYGIGSFAGRLGSGAISDRLGTILTLRIGYVILIVSLLALMRATSPFALIASLVGFGIGGAATDTMFVKVVPDVFGLRALGGVMGVLTLGWRTGAAVGPAAAGFIYDLTGAYTVPFGAAPVVVLISWALFGLGSTRARR